MYPGLSALMDTSRAFSGKCTERGWDEEEGEGEEEEEEGE